MADTPGWRAAGAVMRRRYWRHLRCPGQQFLVRQRDDAFQLVQLGRREPGQSALHEAAEDEIHFLDAAVGRAPQQALASDLVTVAGGASLRCSLPHPPLRRNPFPPTLLPCVLRSSTRSLPAPPASRASAASSTGCWPVSCGRRMAPRARRRASSICCSTCPPASSTAASGRASPICRARVSSPSR